MKFNIGDRVVRIISFPDNVDSHLIGSHAFKVLRVESSGLVIEHPLNPGMPYIIKSCMIFQPSKFKLVNSLKDYLEFKWSLK